MTIGVRRPGTRPGLTVWQADCRALRDNAGIESEELL
jgi:hypothetical protein